MGQPDTPQRCSFRRPILLGPHDYELRQVKHPEPARHSSRLHSLVTAAAATFAVAAVLFPMAFAVIMVMAMTMRMMLMLVAMGMRHSDVIVGLRMVMLVYLMEVLLTDFFMQMLMAVFMCV